MATTIKLKDGTEVSAQGVFGGKEEYQGFLREYLELSFPQEGHTVEELETLFSPENTETLTVIPQGEVQDDGDGGEVTVPQGEFVYSDYTVRGTARVSKKGEDWTIAIRRYQLSQMEKELAEVKAQLTDTQLALCEIYETGNGGDNNG